MNNNNSKTLKFQLIILTIVIVAGTIFVNSIKSNVAYADFDCPVCGSSEVLDYGTDYNDTHSYQCYDCKAKFQTND